MRIDGAQCSLYFPAEKYTYTINVKIPMWTYLQIFFGVLTESCSIVDPFMENKYAQIQEQKQKEDDLWNEFTEYVDRASEIYVIPD